MRKEDHEHIAQCCHSLVGLVQKEENDHVLCYAGVPSTWHVNPEDMPAERPFTQDEFRRFIDRLVWAINSSQGGRMDEEQRTTLCADITNLLQSYFSHHLSLAIPADTPTIKLIAEKLVGLFDEKLRLEDAPLDFSRFVKHCQGEMG